MICSKVKIKIREPVVRMVKKPTPITYIGAGYAKKVGSILTSVEASKVLVITDGFLHQSGLLNGILESISDKNIEYIVFDGVQPDPTFTIVRQASEAAAGCNAVVAVGGGSVLDTAKAVSAAIANHTSAEKLVGMMKVHRLPMPFIAVPTTAGTGSETTIAAVISDPETHAKKQILDSKLVPMFAILDAELTVGLPSHTTAFTALDALTHALEAYVSGYASETSNQMARTAIRLIMKNLPLVREDPKNLEVREALLVGSFLAGQAFTRTYVGYVHAFAHTIGSKYGVPHGLANAILLPHVMNYYLQACQKQFAELAVVTGLADAQEDEKARARRFVDRLWELSVLCEIPERFEKFPAADIDAVIDQSFRECHGIYPVPCYYTRRDARKLLNTVCRTEA